MLRGERWQVRGGVSTPFTFHLPPLGSFYGPVKGNTDSTLLQDSPLTSLWGSLSIPF